MGKDDRAVVDAELKVNGVNNLRIADSTIMPRIVAVPTMPACVLIGLGKAELLIGSPTSRLKQRTDRPPWSRDHRGSTAGSSESQITLARE